MKLRSGAWRSVSDTTIEEPSRGVPSSLPGAAGLPAGRHPRLPVRVSTLDSLKHRNFKLFFSATFCLGAGYWIHTLVMGWLAYDLTRSPLLTTLAIGVENLPFLLAGPVGGFVADRWDLRKFLILVAAYQGIVTAAFSAFVMFGNPGAPHLFAFAFLMGLSWAVADPPKVSFIPSLVPRHVLINAFSLNGLSFNLTRFVIPTMAGVVLVWIGPGRTLMFAASLYLAACLATVLIVYARAQGQASERTRLFGLSPFIEGLRYVAREPFVLAIIVLGGILPVLYVPFVYGMLPVYASENFHVGPSGLGILLSAVGVGSAVSTVVLASAGEIKYKGRVLVFFMGLIILGMTAFSQSPGIWLAFACLVVASGGMTGFLTVEYAAIQVSTPDYIRGRISAIGLMTFGLYPVGSLLAGFIAERTTTPTATLVAGGVLLALTAIILLRAPSIWAFRQTR
ncbi:MAG: MFS transporter [SAR202 cluster bacterium]|nr:MFS transporter [SAR202 cluster bacterium]